MTDREKALAAARDIVVVQRFFDSSHSYQKRVEETVEIILRHMRPDLELLEALRPAMPFLMCSHSYVRPCKLCEIREGIESVLSKRERETQKEP
jgi:hypothetical protein